jgi:hypothetical protein
MLLLNGTNQKDRHEPAGKNNHQQNFRKMRFYHLVGITKIFVRHLQRPRVTTLRLPRANRLVFEGTESRRVAPDSVYFDTNAPRGAAHPL